MINQQKQLVTHSYKIKKVNLYFNREFAQFSFQKWQKYMIEKTNIGKIFLPPFEYMVARQVSQDQQFHLLFSVFPASALHLSNFYLYKACVMRLLVCLFHHPTNSSTQPDCREWAPVRIGSAHTGWQPTGDPLARVSSQLDGNTLDQTDNPELVSSDTVQSFRD